MTFDKMIEELKAEFPSFKLVEKSQSKFMWFLFNMFLMKYWCPLYMSNFTTVLRCTVYMPKWLIGTTMGVDVLRHERVHMRDSKGWRILYYGPMYCLLPIGPSGRAYWELRGYKESMRAAYERMGWIPNSHIEFYANQFTSSNYLWMWPFPEHIKKILEGYRKEIEGK